MKSVASRAFLSRSFKPEFADTVGRVEAICNALDIETVCVDRASSTPPASEAIDKINEVDFLIALCGREQKESDGAGYLTSQSVRDEITMAAAAKKPIICFLEDGVELKGFAGSMFTYKKLSNFREMEKQDLFQIVNGVHEEKLKVIDRVNIVAYATGITNYYVPKCVMQVELKNTPEGMVWDYIMERTYVFEDEHRSPLIHSAFCFENHQDCSAPPLWRIEIFKNGSQIAPELDIVDEGPGKIEIQSTTLPYPAKGDTLLVRERYQSPFLNVIHGGQSTRRPIRIGDALLRAYDGNYIINRVEELVVRIKLPASYLVTDMQPIVSTFSTRLDHLNESEMRRLREIKALKRDSFFDHQTFELRVDRPLYQYFYGLAWDVPKVTDVAEDIAAESADWR